MSGTAIPLAQFAQMLGAAGVGTNISSWTANIPGAATSRSLGTGFADAPFIEWFGICGQGGDDTAVFTAAVQSGLPFQLGPKTYIVNGSWSTGTATSLVLRGVPGVSRLLRMAGGSTGAWIGLECAVVDIDGVVFDANGSTVVANTWNVLVDSSVTTAWISRCAFRNNSGSLGRGLAVIGNSSAITPQSYLIRDCEFSGNSSDGCGLFAVAVASVTGCRGFGNGGSGIGAAVIGTPSTSLVNRNVLIQGNLCWGNTLDGINLGTIDPSGATPPNYTLASPSLTSVSVLDNNVWSNGAYGIQAYGDYLDVSGNQVTQTTTGAGGIVMTARYSRVGRNTLNVPGVYIGIDSGGCFDCDVNDNSVTGATIGINPGGSQFVTVSGNKIRGCAIGMSIYDIEADGNGVPFPQPINALTVERNVIVVGSGATGVSVLDGGSNLAIVENRFLPLTTSVGASQALALRSAGVTLRGNPRHDEHGGAECSRRLCRDRAAADYIHQRRADRCTRPGRVGGVGSGGRADHGVGTYGEYVSRFGTLQARRYDMGTAVAVAVQQGCSNMVCVRVTDGTDHAATYALAYSAPNYGALLTSRYTGSYGNAIGVVIGAGSAANSTRLTLTSPGNAPEVFDNIPGTGVTFWTALVAAVNNGNSVRGPSQLVMASIGSNTSGAIPNLLPSANQVLSGGTDGAGGVSTSLLLGTDGNARTGMYALRASGCSVGLLVDCADVTSWSTQVAFALSESLYMIDCGPAGDNIANAASTKSGAGIDTYAMKVLFGDWIYWLDTTNGGQVRLISPSSFSAGLLANLSPEQSSLNKAVQAVVGTQKSYTNTIYSQADLSQLALAGLDVIANPAPGGAYFAPAMGRNASSNAVIHGDNYTRLTNFIASTINMWLGQVVGLLQNPTTRRQAFVLLDQFFFNLWQQGIIGNANGTQPYGIVLDDSNNPASRVALGYMQANVQVQYQSIVEYMLAEIEGGQSVQIVRQAVAPALTA